MKKIILVFVLMSAMVSCTKMPINGDLEGMWQLMRIETKTDTIETRAYWSFQLHLVQLGNLQYYGRFEHKGNELRMYDFVVGEFNYNKEIDKGGDIECAVTEKTVRFLSPYGIYRLDTRFKVEMFNEDYMRLRSDDACLYLRKY